MPKTLTEFSGTLLRMASRAEVEARKSIPKELLRVAPAQSTADAVTAKPSDNASATPAGATADSPSDAADQALAEQAASGTAAIAGSESGPQEERPGEAGTTEDEMQPGAAEEEEREEALADQDLSGNTEAARMTPGGAKISEVNADQAVEAKEQEAETSAVKEILDKAVGEATGTSGDRLSRLREAVRAAGRQAERVRLVRVFGGEEEVAGAKKIGEFQYLVDLMPQSMKQTFEQNDRDKKRGPRRPSGGGKQKGGEGSLEGSFSMESVAQDRRSERGPGAGRGGPGGGRGRGGGPGGGRGGPGGGRGGPGGGPGGGRGGPGGGRGSGGPKPGGAPRS